MTENSKPLVHPWLVAAWPGMGHVASTAGYYLMAKLGMHLFAEFSPRELFDIEHVDVKGGLIHAGQLPRSRCFLWRDPDESHDILLFLGEAQPPAGKRAFCQSLIQFATRQGVERVLTFAAMSTRMHPARVSRVYGAATDEVLLAELEQLDLEILQEGHISGLNGVLLGEAQEAGIPGACLLGEMPHIFSHLPFPGASLAVLKVFCEWAGLTIDLDELGEQAQELGQKLGEILAQLDSERGSVGQPEPEAEEGIEVEPPAEPRLSLEQERRIEELFRQAGEDRSKAYELKQELDRLDVFADYEDRFLDLFKQAGE